jgi:hypothetical protein
VNFGTTHSTTLTFSKIHFEPKKAFHLPYIRQSVIVMESFLGLENDFGMSDVNFFAFAHFHIRYMINVN